MCPVWYLPSCKMGSWSKVCSQTLVMDSVSPLIDAGGSLLAEKANPYLE